ncbi:hypothetical protein K9L97_01305 [Candidatus Woesearchaeota archaeon]|nr:hypothetical protein [Candidatus Woesearchaeota archaeon]
MRIKKNVLYLVLAIFVVSLFGVVSLTYGASAAKTSSATGKVVANTGNGDIQTVKLTYENYVYVLEPSELKVGVPVRMEVDLKSVVGCMKAVRIPAFGVSEYVSEGNNIIEFTPDKSGTFNIACSMGMGATTFDVVDSSGEKADYVEKSNSGTQNSGGAGSCGAGGSGGCGCGG